MTSLETSGRYESAIHDREPLVRPKSSAASDIVREDAFGLDATVFSVDTASRTLTASIRIPIARRMVIFSVLLSFVLLSEPATVAFGETKESPKSASSTDVYGLVRSVLVKGKKNSDIATLAARVSALSSSEAIIFVREIRLEGVAYRNLSKKFVRDWSVDDALVDGAFNRLGREIGYRVVLTSGVDRGKRMKVAYGFVSHLELIDSLVSQIRGRWKLSAGKIIVGPADAPLVEPARKRSRFAVGPLSTNVSSNSSGLDGLATLNGLIRAYPLRIVCSPQARQVLRSKKISIRIHNEPLANVIDEVLDSFTNPLKWSFDGKIIRISASKGTLRGQ